jgi:hypothetical protein
MKLNLKVAIVLIEHMRHVIVHKRGKVSLTKFINSVCVKSGISIKTVKAAGMWKEIESFFVCHGCDGGHKLLLADLEGHNCPCQTVS